MRKIIILTLTLCFAIILATANIWFGSLNLDEGWYLYAAQAFASVRALPYRDFFFTQAPLMPIVYGMACPLWSSGGVLGGRIFTAVLGLAAAVLAAYGTAAFVPRDRRFAAALTTFMLLACNVYHSYFTVIPKTYALASLMVSGALLALANVRVASASRRSAVFAALGGFLFAGAASTRLSLGVGLIVVGFFLLANFKKYRFAWFFFGVGGVVGLTLMLGIVASQDFGAFEFANSFHGERTGGGLIFTAGSISRLVRNYMPMVMLAAASAAVSLTTHSEKKWTEIFNGQVLLLLLTFTAIFTVHVSSPFPYDDYQVPSMPLAAVAVSTVFWTLLPDSVTRRDRQFHLLFLFLVCSGAFALSSPQNETWFVLRKDRFWVEKKEMSDIAKLREVADNVKVSCDGAKTILTMDTYIAVQCGLCVPSGFEMGPFGYFSELSDAEARRYHVLNMNVLRDTVAATSAPCAAFSGYGLAMTAPAMTKIAPDEREKLFEIIDGYYHKVRSVPDFGQESTTLTIWKRK